jgi:PAS domain S-box-containing protein
VSASPERASAPADLPRILVVDDEPDDVAIARRELGARFRVDSVGSAAEARAQLRRERYDLVVLDYRLGDTNALAFLREAQGSEGSPAVVVVSGRNDPRVAAAAHDLGAFAFLAKDSFAGGALVAVAREALRLDEPPAASRRSVETRPSVIERMSEALYAVDEDGVIVLANRATERLLGYGTRELLGLGLERVMGPDALGAIASCLASGSAFVETELEARSGARISVLVSPTPLVDPGGHVAVVRDFRAFRSRIGSLEKANRKLQDNLVEVAVQVLHNIGNAAASLDVRVEDLKRELEGDEEEIRIIQHAARAIHGQDEVTSLILDAASALEAGRSTQLAAVATIKNAIGHCAHVIDHARSFAGKTRHEEPMLDLPRSVERVTSIARDLARREGVPISITTTLGASASLLPIPETGFEQLLLNLLKNAVESTAARARRDASAPLSVSVRARVEGGKLHLAVEDSGEGATSEVAARAFQFGFTTKPEGSGFGLHASAEFVERLSGKIFLESPGRDQGATVRVEIPVAAAARAAA